MSDRLTDEELEDLDKWAAFDLDRSTQAHVWAPTDEVRALRTETARLAAEVEAYDDLARDLCSGAYQAGAPSRTIIRNVLADRARDLTAARQRIAELEHSQRAIASAFGCLPDDESDLIEAARLLVEERDTARRDVERLQSALNRYESERVKACALGDAARAEAARYRAVYEAAKTWCETVYIGKPHPRFPAYPGDELLHAVNAIRCASLDAATKENK